MSSKRPAPEGKNGGEKAEAMRFWGDAGGLVPSWNLLWLTPGTSLPAGTETLTKAQRTAAMGR